MNRALTFVVFAAAAFGAGAQQSSIDQDRLEAIRKMPPEERAKLKERLEQIKKLPPVEKERLKDNLKKIKTMPAEEVRKIRERAKKLTPEEHRDYSELGMGFFLWAHREKFIEGFPRGMFFHWLKNEKPGKIDQIRALEPGIGSPRVDEFMKLYHEFRDVTLARTEEHIRRHKCMDLEVIHEIRDTSPKEFWPKWQEVTRSCQSKRAVPGPVAPRPLDKK